MKDTKIEWADHSWSPWIGCTKVSPGCANCYAENLMDKRMKRVNWGLGHPRKRTSKAYWNQPLKWQNQFGESYGVELMHPPITVFPSLCDWLDPEVPIEWLADFLALIRRTPNLQWLLLTKRPELFRRRMNMALKHELTHTCGEPSDGADFIDGWVNKTDMIPANVAIGVSAEDQERWDWRVPALLQIPAHWRFVSVEPMLGPINLQFARRASMRLDDHSRQLHASIDQVIFGGESGPGARPCNIDWIRDGVSQCREAGVKAFVKQLGSRAVQDLSAVIPEATVAKDAEDEFTDADVAAWEHNRRNNPMCLKHPKGGDQSEWPEDLRVREVME